MLRRAERVGLNYVRKGLTGKKGIVRVMVGRQIYNLGKMERAQYDHLGAVQARWPVTVIRVDGRTYWLFQGKFYWENDDLSADEVYALLVSRQQRQEQQIARAQAIVAMDADPRPRRRRGIPDDVKHYVWKRDAGRCMHCASNSELQYDHVIPVALGGGDDVANLQLLCGPCNRRKRDGLSVTPPNSGRFGW